MEFVTVIGTHLVIELPALLVDKLCIHTGNGYKAICWVMARCSEVENPSTETIAAHINFMVKNVLNGDEVATQLPRAQVRIKSTTYCKSHFTRPRLDGRSGIVPWR
jgi:hypothetical protein